MLATLLLLAVQQSAPIQPPLTPEPRSRFQPWRDNYVQLLSWRADLPMRTPAASGGRNRELETEFQLSFRYLLNGQHLEPWLWDDSAIYAGYTTRSYWQVYNREDSRPFRTTEHAPEIFLERPLRDGRWLMRLSPLLHQSNGEAGTVSRSWDRSYAEFVWRSDEQLQGLHTARPDEYLAAQSVSAMLWYPWDSTPSDNPDILDYLGYGQLRYTRYFDVRYKPAISVTMRSNLGSGAEFRGAFEVDLSLTFTGISRLHLQFFRGYGDSLLEYDRLVTRYGFGFELIPW